MFCIEQQEMMMQSGSISPALDEPALPEFRGSLSLASSNSAATGSLRATSDGLDVIDLQTPVASEVKGGGAGGSTSATNHRHRSTSPGSSGKLLLYQLNIHYDPLTCTVVHHF